MIAGSSLVDFFFAFSATSIRHHVVDSNYWLGFTFPGVDDLFGTNPNPKDVVFARRRQLLEDK